MKITFFSNFLNHLQTSFCEELYLCFGENFTFVSTQELTEEMRYNGYLDYLNCPYLLYSYLSVDNFKKALDLGTSSDVVIIGAAPGIFIKERLHQNKHTFKYSERLFKQGEWRIFDPRVFYSLIKSHTLLRNKNVYMLCASAFAAKDLNIIFAYPNKKFKWGYFTEVDEIDIEHLIAEKPTDIIQLVWVARFIDWKHPELAIKLAYELKKRGHNFHLNMIGVGVMFHQIKKMIEKLDLSNYISLLQSVDNYKVRDYMLKSNIFLFTSDRNEGWGAVLNEAMSCGCAAVASNLIGAVPYLIKNEHNGLIYKSGNLSDLVEQTEKLIIKKSFRDQISKNAYFTMRNEWSPKIAASRFIKLANSILEKQIISFREGPCSEA